MVRVTTPRKAGVWLLILPIVIWTGSSAVAAEVWHFLDAWHFHKLDGLELCQGEPTWLKDKTYVDPIRSKIDDQLNSWCTVWKDDASGKWRMVYSAKWRPATLLVAESDNGLRYPLQWKGKSLSEVIRQPIRLEAKLRNAQLFAVRGSFHFLDAEDARRLQLGKPIDPRWFDY